MNDETRAEKLLDAINDAQDEMIIAADPEKKSKKRSVPLWVKIGSAAAAVVAVGGITTAVMMNRSPDGLVQPGQPTTSEAEATTNSSVPEQSITAEVSQPDNTSPQHTSTPNDTISEPDQPQHNDALPKIPSNLKFGGMGFEGYHLDDISDFISGNPWSEEQNITAMPVYKNRVVKDQGFSVLTDIDSEELVAEMKSVLIENAALLGVEIIADDIADNLPTPEEREIIAKGYYEAWREEVPKGYYTPQKIEYDTDKFNISTDSSFRTRIEFKEPISLPYSLNTTDIGEVKEIAEYLIEEYTELLGMESPSVSIDDGAYSYCTFDISFYESAGTNEQDIENYFMKKVQFRGNANGDLSLIWIYRNDLAGELVGNYPLISAEEAAEKLKNGEYITSSPVAKDYKPDNYDRVELIYRTDITDEYFIPYYKFWIDVTDEIRAEQKTYGAFYIPAILPEYLDVQTWDGRFN